VVDDDSEVKVVPIRARLPSDKGRRLDVRVDVRCSRCGGDLLVSGASHTLISDEDVDDLRLNVVPWCRCLAEWDGTSNGLIRPDASAPLRLSRAEPGDDLPSGSLRLSGAGSAFEALRNEVDTFLCEVAPQAQAQLTAALERFAAGDEEALSHSLTSCRRLLQTVADAVFTARTENFVDTRGKSRKVGTEEYKNRLLAFLDQGLSGKSYALFDGEMELVVKRLDALYDKVCKGVHSDVGAEEVRLVLSEMYVMLTEVARLARSR
jgi:hypothetical protein